MNRQLCYEIFNIFFFRFHFCARAQHKFTFLRYCSLQSIHEFREREKKKLNSSFQWEETKAINCNIRWSLSISFYTFLSLVQEKRRQKQKKKENYFNDISSQNSYPFYGSTRLVFILFYYFIFSFFFFELLLKLCTQFQNELKPNQMNHNFFISFVSAFFFHFSSINTLR